MTSRFLPSPTAVGVVAIALAGCASLPAPTRQMAAATAFVEAAHAAGAQALAQTELRLAEGKLAMACKAMASQDYDAAWRLSEQAGMDAQFAMAKTQAIKARIAADVARLDARASREELERRAARRPAPGGPP